MFLSGCCDGDEALWILNFLFEIIKKKPPKYSISDIKHQSCTITRCFKNTAELRV